MPPLSSYFTLIAAAPAAPLSIGGDTFAQSEVLDARGLPEIGGGASILITLTPSAAKRLRGAGPHSSGWKTGYRGLTA